MDPIKISIKKDIPAISCVAKKVSGWRVHKCQCQGVHSDNFFHSQTLWKLSVGNTV